MIHRLLVSFSLNGLDAFFKEVQIGIIILSLVLVFLTRYIKNPADRYYFLVPYAFFILVSFIFFHDYVFLPLTIIAVNVYGIYSAVKKKK